MIWELKGEQAPRPCIRLKRLEKGPPFADDPQHSNHSLLQASVLPTEAALLRRSRTKIKVSLWSLESTGSRESNLRDEHRDKSPERYDRANDKHVF